MSLAEAFAKLGDISIRSLDVLKWLENATPGPKINELKEMTKTSKKFMATIGPEWDNIDDEERAGHFLHSLDPKNRTRIDDIDSFISRPPITGQKKSKLC